MTTTQTTNLTTEVTAVRTWKNGKATLTITVALPDGTEYSEKTTGVHAERAVAAWATIHDYSIDGWQDPIVKEMIASGVQFRVFVGSTSSVTTAQTKVNGDRRGCTSTKSGYAMPGVPSSWVEITEGEV